MSYRYTTLTLKANETAAIDGPFDYLMIPEMATEGGAVEVALFESRADLMGKTYALRVGDRIRGAWVSGLLRNPSSARDVTFDLIRGVGDLVSQHPRPTAGQVVIAQRQMAYFGTAVSRVGIGSTDIVTQANNLYGCRIYNLSLTGCGDAANDGGATLQIARNPGGGEVGIPYVVAGCDKATASPVEVFVSEIDVPAGFHVYLSCNSAKDRAFCVAKVFA